MYVYMYTCTYMIVYTCIYMVLCWHSEWQNEFYFLLSTCFTFSLLKTGGLSNESKLVALNLLAPSLLVRRHCSEVSGFKFKSRSKPIRCSKVWADVGMTGYSRMELRRTVSTATDKTVCSHGCWSGVRTSLQGAWRSINKLACKVNRIY